MNAYSDFDAQFEKTLAVVNPDRTDNRDPNQFRPAVNDKQPSYEMTGRFIPPLEGPLFVKKIVHYVKIGGKTTRVICPKTANPDNQCDICSDNIHGHKSKIPALVAKASANSNKVRWVANILILEDKQHPENVGRVMWWEFPNQIMEFINKLRKPVNSRIPSINPFNPLTGEDFFLCMNLIEGYTKYDGSQFLSPQCAIGDEAYITQVRSLCHDLTPHTVIATQAEISDIMAKMGNMPVVQKTYGNIPQQEGFAPGPSVTGFGPTHQNASAMDEFDTVHANAQLTQPVQTPPRPQLAVPPKQPMPIPSRPALQTPTSVMPAQSDRVVPLPETPAVPRPHVNKPVDDENWYM